MTERIQKYLIKKEITKLDNLYRHFNIVKDHDQKRIKEILQEFHDSGLIKLDLNRQVVKIPNFASTPHGKRERHDKHSRDDKRSYRKSSTDMNMKPRVSFGEAHTDVTVVSEKYSLPNRRFPLAVEKEIASPDWDSQNSHEKHRQDLRNLFVMTIDGADSKDLDDAVSISKSFFGKWTLGVHIADVSYYVSKNSELDKEAQIRANSYYLIDTVIPMLPEALSNELCSLNPHTDKKSMTIFMDFDNNGTMTDYRITPSVINSNYRMTYDRVEEIMQGSPEKDTELKKNVKMMEKLFRILNKKRMNDGTVDFNFRERKVKLDEKGLPVKVYQKDRLDSERLIEEFMLAANQAAGDFLTKKGLGLYRIHDVPPAEKYVNLQKFAAKRGVKLPEVPTPKDIQKFVSSLANTPIQMSGEILALRSMAQAAYSRQNVGHFGLGFAKYAHFTSPIRRYADLIVHRLIKYFLFDSAKPAIYTENSLDTIAQHISSQERVAMEAERDLMKIKCVRYMEPFVGQVFDGVVSSVASFGIFIEMKDTGIEAMIRYSDMDDYIVFNEEELTASNRNGTKKYFLGKPIRITITKVNSERGFIDAAEFFEN
ncbi:MAG: ribonuclease R family protein [Brevinema sp.]